jgi:hypothetical protein
MDRSSSPQARLVSLVAAPLVLCGALLTDRLTGPAMAQTSEPPAASEAAASAYQQKLEAYLQARRQYDAAAEAYWSMVVEKRRVRIQKRRAQETVVLADYVLAQPPTYSGPPRPVDPSAPGVVSSLPPRKYVPVARDFLAAAKEHFSFVPKRPRGDIEYKRAYARIAAAAGLTRSQVVRIYAFEAGGNGRYDVQAGLEYSRTGRAISTALGYNQLLTTNSIGLLAEKGDRFIEALKTSAARLRGKARQALERKITIVERMVAFSRTVPVRWSEHEKLKDTPRWFALHALNLDIDVGPLLQVQKLVDSVVFARSRGIDRTLTAAELELMNFTGDGNGFDMVTMPHEMRKRVPTANFFQQRGYERNPVAGRHNVVAKLLAAIDAKMDRESKRAGARSMAAAFRR